MPSTDLTSLLEFYRIPVPALDTHCILKDSAFEYNKALKERKVELPWQNEEKVEISRLIIKLCNLYLLKEIWVF